MYIYICVCVCVDAIIHPSHMLPWNLPSFFQATQPGCSDAPGGQVFPFLGTPWPNGSNCQGSSQSFTMKTSQSFAMFWNWTFTQLTTINYYFEPWFTFVTGGAPISKVRQSSKFTSETATSEQFLFLQHVHLSFQGVRDISTVLLTIRIINQPKKVLSWHPKEMAFFWTVGPKIQ